MHDITPSPEPQPRAADPRIAAALERAQEVLAAHPMQDGVLCWRGWPAAGELVDRIEDRGIEELMACARREDEREAAALAEADADATTAPAEVDASLEQAPVTPSTAPTAPSETGAPARPPEGPTNGSSRAKNGHSRTVRRPASVSNARMLQPALNLVELGGLRIFPVAHVVQSGRCICGKKCASPAKHPRIKAWQVNASAEPAQVRAWWERWPKANIGVACGAHSGIVVLDVDGPEGEASLAELEHAHGALPITVEARTGRGRHLYFAHPGFEVRNSAGKVGRAIDVRGDGGYVIAPPSVHVSGAAYRWSDGRAFGATALAPLPAWIAEDTPDARPAQSLPAPADRAEAYVRAAVEAECTAVRRAQKGGRNTRLNTAAFSLGQLVAGGALAAKQAEFELLTAALACGLTEGEARATIRSGLEAGHKSPRTVPEATQPARANGETHPANDNSGKSVEPWESKLLVTDDGIAPSAGNIELILSNADAWKGRLRYDMRANNIVCEPGSPLVDGPDARPYGSSDDARLAIALEHSVYRLRVSPSSAALSGAISVVAERSAFDPVRDWLDAIRWDGSPRLDNFAVVYLGAANEPINQTYGRCWLLSAVARVYEPGCQVDHTLVLVGSQGRLKSSALRTLAVRSDWFLDSLPSLSDRKASAEVLHGKWIIEHAELDSLGRAELSTAKAWLTAREDRYRAAYAKRADTHPRRCVFAASTNEDAFLRDSSGGRRFWPVATGRINFSALERDLTQIWAEAVTRYRAGEPWHIVDAKLLDAAKETQEGRYIADAWEESIEEFLCGRERVSVADVLKTAIRLEPGRMGQVEQNRVARCLQHLGWVRRQRRDGVGVAADGKPKKRWAYERPAKDDND